MQVVRAQPYTAFVTILAGLVIAMVAMPAGARADVKVTCNAGSCDNAWHNTDVIVDWTVDGMVESGCVDQTLSTDSPTTAGTELSCTEEGGSPVTIRVKIDKTPPAATGATSGRPADSGVWFNHPVTYTFSGTDALSGIDSCTQVTYSGPDTASATLNGTCTDKAGNTSTVVGAAVHYDATPPVVGSALPSRPADFNGWYNHPVTFTFFGADATSGLAGCTSATYSGPSDSTAVVGGACTDNAGNRAASSAPLQYDSTPPAPANLTVTARKGALLLTWPSIADANNFVVTRSQPGRPGTLVTVYSGSGHSVLDKGLQNNTKYSYTITNTDQAGNSSSQTVDAVPTGSSLLPAVGARVTSAPLLTWKRVKRARYYNVQLFRGRHKVLSAWPSSNSFQVRPAWRFKGKRRTLRPGSYRWYVWPGIGKRSRHRYGPLLGRSSFRFAAP